MPYKNFEEFVTELAKKRDRDLGLAPESALDRFAVPSIPTSNKPQQPPALVTKAKDVPFENVYQRLNSGTYIPRYDNFTTGFNEEERLARQQGTGEKLARGFGKFWTKTGINVLDATIGTVNGISEMIGQGRFSAFYDNDFAKKLDDYRTRTNADMMHYYTQEEQSKNFFQKLGTVNFWANDFGDAMAFLAGAALPEVIIAGVSGGTSVPLSLAKFGGRAGATLTKQGLRKATLETGEALFKSGIQQTDDILKNRLGREAIRGYHRGALIGDKVGGALQTAGFLARTSGFEAGMEARHNLKEAMDTFVQRFQEENGRMPDVNEVAEYTDKALNAANGVFAANMAILSVSNAAMFGKMFGVRLPQLSQNNIFNRALGYGFDMEKGIATAQKVGKAQKALGYGYEFLKRPVSEGLFEEGLQGVAGTTMQKYLESTYDSKNMEADGLMSSLYSAFAQQYGTAEGWNEIGIGMLVGSLGGGIMQNSAAPFTKDWSTPIAGTFSDSYGAKRKNVQARIDKANQQSTNLSETLKSRNLNRSMARASSAYKASESDAQMKKTNFQFVLNQKELMTSNEVVENYNAVIDSTVLSQEQIALLDQQGITQEQYKERLKTEFQEDVKSIDFAERVTSALGIQNIEATKGNKVALKEAMMWNIFNGRDAERSMQSIAREIQTAVGKEGIASIMNFFAQMSEDGRNKLREQSEKREALEKAKQEVVQIQNEIQQLSAKGQNDPNKIAQRNKAAEQYTVASQAILRLTNELDAINKALEAQEKASKINFGVFAEQDELFFADNASQAFDDVTEYITALETTGKTQEAIALKEMLTDFAMQADMHREFLNAHRRMMEGDFFQSMKGKNLLQRLLGDSYTMPQELVNALNENDNKVRQSLEKVGISTIARESENIGEEIKKLIEENEELSDREKFRLESALRLTLNMETYDNMVSDFRDYAQDLQDAQDQPVPPTNGDTIALKKKLSEPPKDTTALDAVRKSIEEITDQIDYLLESSKDPERLPQLEQQLAELKAQLEQAPPKEKSSLANVGSEISPDVSSIQEEISQLEEELSKGTDLFRSQEIVARVAELQQQLDNTQEITTPVTEDISENTQLQEEIARLEREIDMVKNKVRVVETEEFVRYKELQEKAQRKELTDQEISELETLEKEVDRWIFVTGAVTDNTRLSDLIEQEAVLSKTPIEKPEDIQVVAEDEIVQEMAREFKDSSKHGNTHIGYNFEAATITPYNDATGEYIEVAHITEKELRRQLAPLLEQEMPYGDEAIPAQFKQTKKGNFLLPMSLVKKINDDPTSPIYFPLDFQDKSRNYGVIIVRRPDMNEEIVGSFLPSDFEDAEDAGSTDAVIANRIDSEAIYNSNPEETVALTIYTGDPYNQGLLQEYKKKKEEVEKYSLTDITEEDLPKEVQEQLKLGGQNVLRLRAKKNKTTADKQEIAEREAELEKRKQAEIEKFIKDQEKDRAGAQKKLEEAKDNLKRNLRVVALNKDNRNVSVMKGQGETVYTNELDRKWQMFRDMMIEDNEDALLSAYESNQVFQLPYPELAINKVFPGFPNVITGVSEDGKPTNRFVPFTDETTQNVVDIGVMVGDRIETRSKDKGVDTTLLLPEKRKGTDKKTPFVVIKTGNKKIAYPVRIAEQQRPSLEPLQQTFEADMAPSEKAKALNTMIAQLGLDIKEPGNSFYVGVGEVNNLTEENFNNILGKLEAIEYFYPLKDWTTGSVPIKEVLKNQALVNIDMNKPVHSPKISFDLRTFFDAIPQVGERYANRGKEAIAKATEANLNEEVKYLKSARKQGADNVKKDC
jgi:hypothetical protein